MAAAEYDVFLSHAWADGERPQQIADALAKAGLCVWFDSTEINDFASITHAVTEGLAKSKTLLAYYSKTYPLRRACQWELTAAFLAAQSEGDPRNRVLVINPEDDAEHIHPIELRDAKFRNAPNTDGEMQPLVRAIVKHIAAVDGPLPDIHPLDPPVWHGIKPVRYEQFVGRFEEMWKIHSALHETRVVQITGASGQDIAQVTGLGGIGKSLLAREYALRFGPAYPGGVFWLSAYGNDDTKAALSDEGREVERDDQMTNFCQELGVSVDGKKPGEVRSALGRVIERRGRPCLWVVDDLPSGLHDEAFQLWCAPHQLARTLITTRSRTYVNMGSTGILSLDVLPEDDAYQLLTSRRQPTGKDEEEQARELARDLGYHALALDVTASALLSSGTPEPFGDFRAKLARPDKDALELAETLAEALPNGHEKSIAQTMLRSIRGLGVEGQDFLRLASVLAVGPIPASLVTAVFEKADKLSHEDAEERASLAFKQVTSASLAEVAGESKDARAVHTLVSRAVRFHEKNAQERTQMLRAAAVEALTTEIAKASLDPSLHKQIEFHVAHARQAVKAPETIPEANLIGWLARYDYERGSYASARTLYEREVEFRRRVQGPEDPDTLRSMNNLAETLREHGDLAEGRKLTEEVLGIQRRVLGREDPDTLRSMNNLAETLRDQGDLAGARKLQEETLAIRRRVFGPEHPDTLSSMDNLAGTLYTQGDLAGARKLTEEVLGIQRRVLGPEHLVTLISMNNLAETLRAQRHFAGARKLHEKTLAIRRRVLGPEHPDTLMSMSNLALTLWAQRDLAGARKLQEETLAIRRRLLGPQHMDTSKSAWNLFATLRGLGESEAAVTVLRGDLLWLLDRDPATLDADQRQIREYVAQVVKGSG